MPHYQVRYELGDDGSYIYPEGIARVVWKRLVYHGSEPMMVGDTDDEVEGSEPDIVPLQAKRAAALMKRYEASQTKPRQQQRRGKH
jgi:hypothetical protein